MKASGTVINGNNGTPLSGRIEEIYDGEKFETYNFSGGVFSIDQVDSEAVYNYIVEGYQTVGVPGDWLGDHAAAFSLEIKIYPTGGGTSGGGGATSKDKQLLLYSGAGLLLALLLLKDHKKQAQQLKGIEKKDVETVLIIGGSLIGFSLLKKTLEGVGIWDRPETKVLDAATKDPNSFWSPSFYKNYSGHYSYSITEAQAGEMAESIYDAFGAFNDCEECVKAVFRQMRTKSNVSYLVDVFNRKYGQDLLTFLRGGIWPQDRLSDTDVAEINSMLSSLPNS